jgi:4-oxalocrotonate tautomerase
VTGPAAIAVILAAVGLPPVESLSELIMPIITIQQFPGRTPQQKQALAERITHAVREVYGPTAQAVQVMIQEIQPDDWFAEGVAARTLPRTYGQS